MPYIALFAAIIPGVFILYRYYRRDKYKPEPKSAIFGAFFLGAAVVLPAGLLEHALLPIGNPENIFVSIIENFLIIALIEELAKYLSLKFQAGKSQHYDEYFDGILYGVAIASGFATFENIFYVMDHGLGVAALRAILSVPSHILEGAIIGYWHARVKIGKEFNRPAFLGVFITVIMHGFFFFVLSYPPVAGIGLFLTLIPMIIMLVMVRHYIQDALKRDQAMFSSELQTIDQSVNQSLTTLEFVKNHTWLSTMSRAFLAILGVISILFGAFLALGFVVSHAEKPEENSLYWLGLCAVPFLFSALFFWLFVKLKPQSNAA
ncbi:MAG: PrsW family intramembrane metalloprotease [Leptospiraceae bacterium]|nr:PrsW family intramembrane metalloprotease [Leptospiraceae bacterium]